MGSRGPKRSRAQREHDLAITAQLRLKGHTQLEIADVLGVHRTQITRDLQTIEARWRQESVEHYDVIKQRELRRLELVEREAWEAWQRSIGQRTKTVRKVSGEGDRREVEETTYTWSEAGGAPYLMAALRAMEQRCRILGLLTEAKGEGAGAGDGRNPYDQLTDDQRIAEVVAILETVRAAAAGAAARESGAGGSATH